jgi:hypothetical protein
MRVLLDTNVILDAMLQIARNAPALCLQGIEPCPPCPLLWLVVLGNGDRTRLQVGLAHASASVGVRLAA